MITVIRKKNELIDAFLMRFKKKTIGIIKEAKNKRCYIKPSEIKHRIKVEEKRKKKLRKKRKR